MQLICMSLRQPVTLHEIVAEFRLCGEVINPQRM